MTDLSNASVQAFYDGSVNGSFQWVLDQEDSLNAEWFGCT